MLIDYNYMLLIYASACYLLLFILVFFAIKDKIVLTKFEEVEMFASFLLAPISAPIIAAVIAYNRISLLLKRENKWK